MSVQELMPIKVGFHIGNVIQLLADLYGTGSSIVREAVQNAVDKSAKNIYVVVDCVKGFIRVYDDGLGAGPEEIRKKFENIGLSLKNRAAGYLGEKGIGNLAGLAGAEEWQLVTRNTKEKGDPLRVFSFSREELKKSDDVQVTFEELPSPTLNGAPFRGATTVLRLQNVDEIILKQIGDKELIERTLREAFNHHLKRDQISLTISYRDFKGKTIDFKIKPTQYRGVPMDPVVIETEYGQVSFRFYHLIHPVEKPTIVVQHQGANALPLSNFFFLNILPKDIQHLFTKGYFEGEIELSFGEQNADRTAFRANHQCQVFVKAVVSFAEDVLQPAILQLEDEDRNDRLKRVAEGTLRKMRAFLNRFSATLPPTLHVIALKYKKSEDGGGIPVPIPIPGCATTSVKVPGETDRPGPGTKKPVAPAPVPTKPRVLPSNTLNVLKVKSDEAKAAKAAGKKVEQVVKKPYVELTDGLSIQLIHPAAEDPFNWRSRTTKEGVIQFNIVSNEFLEAERRGQSELSRFMLLLLQKEITCATIPLNEANVFDRSFESTFLHLWRASLQG